MVAILYKRDNCKCIRLLKSDVRGTKKTPRIILKATHFSRFQSGSWGREYWVFSWGIYVSNWIREYDNYAGLRI